MFGVAYYVILLKTVNSNVLPSIAFSNMFDFVEPSRVVRNSSRLKTVSDDGNSQWESNSRGKENK